MTRSRNAAGSISPLRARSNNASGNDLATLLVACVNLQSDAGLLEGFGHSSKRELFQMPIRKHLTDKTAFGPAAIEGSVSSTVGGKRRGVVTSRHSASVD
jgi:hypothetical protein